MRLNNHTLIAGITGSGKTYLTQRTIENKTTPFTIFINTQHEISAEKVADVVVYSTNEIIELFGNYIRLDICFNPPEDDDLAIAEVESLKNFIFAIGKQVNIDSIVNWLTLYIDEAQLYSSKIRPNKTINTIFTRGRRHGIIAVAIGQRPAEISHTIITQCNTHIYFKLGQYELKYFHRHGIPIEKHKKHLKKKYHFIVFEQGEVKEHPPI